MDWKEIEKEEQRLVSIYNISSGHAGCYMCNFGDKYICEVYNGGCEDLDKCKSIYKKEQKVFNCFERK